MATTVLAALYIMWFVLFILGIIKLKSLRNFDGQFVINHSNPTKDLVTLVLESDLDDIESKGRVTLKVTNE